MPDDPAVPRPPGWASSSARPPWSPSSCSRNARKIKTKSLTVGKDHSFSWKVGTLKKGSYVAKFTLGKQTVKTIRITVR